MRTGFERCILAEFFSCEVLEVEYVVEQSRQPLKLLQNASACLLQAAPPNFPDSSLQELPCQHRHLLPVLSHIFCGTKSTVASYLSSLVLREALAQGSWPDPRPAAAYLCSLSVLLEPLSLCLSNGSLPTHPQITTLDRNKAMGYPLGL